MNGDLSESYLDLDPFAPLSPGGALRGWRRIKTCGWSVLQVVNPPLANKSAHVFAPRRACALV